MLRTGRAPERPRQQDRRVADRDVRKQINKNEGRVTTSIGWDQK